MSRYFNSLHPSGRFTNSYKREGIWIAEIGAPCLYIADFFDGFLKNIMVSMTCPPELNHIPVIWENLRNEKHTLTFSKIWSQANFVGCFRGKPMLQEVKRAPLRFHTIRNVNEIRIPRFGSAPWGLRMAPNILSPVYCNQVRVSLSYCWT